MSVCNSPDKVDGLCDGCLRNVDMKDIHKYSFLLAFTPRNVKTLKPKFILNVMVL